MTIEYVTLLSEDEYEHLKKNIPRLECCWWLRSARYHKRKDDNDTVFAAPDRVGWLGNIDRTPIPKTTFASAVRPALKITEHDLDEKKKIGFGNNVWTYIGDNLLLSDYIVGFSKFDEKENVSWNDCALKQKLEMFAQKRGWTSKGVG